MKPLFANNASSALATAAADGDDELVILAQDAAAFPTPATGEWFPVTAVDAFGNIEVMRCTARAGTTLTVDRAQEGTTARGLPIGTRIEVRFTAGLGRSMLERANHTGPSPTFGTEWTAQFEAVSTAYGRALLAVANVEAVIPALGLGTAALLPEEAFAPAEHVGSGGTAHAQATGTAAGFMSASDYTKLLGVQANANNYVHPTADGSRHVPANGTTNNKKVLISSDTAGLYTWSFVSWSDLLDKPATVAGLALTDFAASAQAQVGPAIGAAAAKATPVDADVLAVLDSTASFGLRKFTWANLKSVLASTFAALTHAHPASQISDSTATGRSVLTAADATAGRTALSAAAAAHSHLAADITNFSTSAQAQIGPGIDAAAAKSTPIDADVLPLLDSTASNALKKFTWANLKSVLASTFAALVHTHIATDISDSTAVGRALMKAADAAAGRSAIGAFSASGGSISGAVGIRNDVSGNGAIALNLQNLGTGASTEVVIDFEPNSAGGARNAKIRSTQVTAGNVANLSFWTANNNTPAEALRLNPDTTAVFARDVTLTTGEVIRGDYFQAFRSSAGGNQSISANTLTKVTWNVANAVFADWDNSNNRVLLKRTGRKRIYARVFMLVSSGTFSGASINVYIMVNGVNQAFKQVRPTAAAESIEIEHTMPTSSVNDVIEIYVQSTIACLVNGDTQACCWTVEPV